MASRLNIPQRRIDFSAPTARVGRWYERQQSLGTRLMIWRLLWFPLWFGGDIPAPWLPRRTSEPSAPDTPAGRELSKALDSIGRRAWLNTILACLARGLWLPFAMGSVVAIVEIIRDRDWSPERFAWIWAVTIPVALLLGFFLRPDRRRVASMLDRTFGLRDRMTTAVEAIEGPFIATSSPAPLPYLQIADAANAAIGLKSDPRFRIHPPSREISLAILSGLLLMALLFLRGVGGSLPVIGEQSVPHFVPAAERRTAAAAVEDAADPAQRPPTVQEVEQAADRSNAAKEDLNALADALDANALTQPAADAIRAGDYATAAQTLRDIAGQTGDLPPESQAALADALDAAAAATGDSSPALSNAASQAADGLRQGGDAAEEGVRDLGDAVDLAGESVIPQDQLANQMEQAQQAAANQTANQSQGADAAQAQNQTGASQNGSDQSNANQSDQSGQASGDAGQPGESSSSSGADAQPGQASTGDQQQPSDGNASDSSSAQSGQDGQSASGEPSSTDAGQPGSGQDGSGSEPGASSNGGEGQDNPQGDGSQTGRPGTGDSADQSSSAASSQSTGGGASNAGQQTPASSNDQQSAGAATDNQTPEAVPTGTSVVEAPTPSSAGSAPTVAPNQSVSLNDQGGGESIQLGGGGSASSLGSGAGVMVSGGDATQQPVPTAGPQSNRVPEPYRSIVENYFSRDGD